MIRISILTTSLLFSIVMARATVVTAGDKTVGPNLAKWTRVQHRAISFLKTAQDEDGSWTSPQAAGLSALATTALLESGLKADDPVVARGLKYLESLVNKDGGIYHAKTLHRNYETSISLLAFSTASRTASPAARKRYARHIAGARDFLKHL